MSAQDSKDSPAARLSRALAYKVFGLATRLLAPVQGVVIAGIRFCKKNNFLFLNDWRTDVADFVVAGKDKEVFVVSTADTTIGVSIRKTGEFDFEKFEYALSLLPAGFRLDTMYDIGANIGIICIPAVKRGIARRAIAIEPEPKNYQLLVANIYLNGLQESITHHNIALGAADGQVLKFELAESNFGDHRVRVASGPGKYDESGRAEIDVRSETFDSIAADIDAATSLLWMDVQGYEGHVLTGAKKAIDSGAYLVTEFWPYGMKRAGCLDSFKLAVARYRVFYDLSDPNAVPISIGELDALFDRIGDTGESTDILLC